MSLDKLTVCYDEFCMRINSLPIYSSNLTDEYH